MFQKDIRVALVHDFLIQYGGAERVLEVLAEMFPDAPIYTLLYDREKMRGKFEGKAIYTSFLQKFPKFLRKKYKFLLPFMPVAPETFDLRDYDLIISSSGAWSKGIVTKLNTKHIAYIHSPMRFVWDYNEKYLSENRKEHLKFFIRPFLTYLRIWDKSAADRPDYLIANSRYTKERIRKYYRRESQVIYPPVNVKSQILNLKLEDKNTKYFLIISRLSAYKKIDCVIEAFNKLELPLIIIGEGKEEKYFRSIANKNIRFLGWLPDEKIAQYYENARAFIFPTVDDFGIAPVEAMMHGIPVLAIRKGGAKEIVSEGITGEFFDAQIPEIVADCVRRFVEKEKEYDKQIIINRVKEFSKEKFKKEFREYIEKNTKF